VRDREAAEGERIRYWTSILPRYARRSKSLEVLIPVLYLKGLSAGDFEEALAALVGKDAPSLSASTIARLKEAWTEEHLRWQKRDLSAKRYVYCWADGIHLEARLEDQAQCILVIIGATPEGKRNSSASPMAGRDCPLDNGRSVEETGCGKRTSGPRAERLDEIRDKA
jgi:transposase-like protein